MQYRHEWKHEINASDRLVLLARLSAVMRPDPHSIGGRYRIRSLYFDSPTDAALREKIDGVNVREKFRIRYYNGDTSFIVLEKKRKINGLCAKESCRLTPEEARRIAEGDFGFLAADSRPLCVELCCKMRAQGLRAKTIVDYTREAFCFGPGNVRVTIDSGIRTGLTGTDFLNPEAVTVPAGDAPMILEVNWDGFLHDILRDAVSVPNRRTAAFSKYQQCRIYG